METSLDILKKNMIALGATKTMTESKTLEIVLLALTGTEELERIREELDILERAKDHERSATLKLENAEFSIRHARHLSERVEEAEKKLNEKIEEFKKEVDLFNKTVAEMETPEARDKVRLSEYYKVKKEAEESELFKYGYQRKGIRR